MPTPTYDLIASNVLGSAASSVTFSSIPATYRDLVVVVQAESASSVPSLRLRLNGDTANMSSVYAAGDGSSASTGTATQIDSSPVSLNSSQPSFLAIYNVMDYSATDKHKTVLHRANQTVEPDFSSFWGTQMAASRWASTSAVTSLVFVLSNGGNIETGSSFHLYGIVS